MANAASQSSAISSYLQQALPFWSVLTAPQRQLLLSNTTLYKYQPGTRIYEIGSVFQGLLVLRTGRLRSFIYSPDSREATLFTIQEGDMSILALSEVREHCGVELCFEVLQPSELLCIHENAFFILSHTVPRVQQEILSATYEHGPVLDDPYGRAAARPAFDCLFDQQSQLKGCFIGKAVIPKQALLLLDNRQPTRFPIEFLHTFLPFAAGFLCWADS